HEIMEVSFSNPSHQLTLMCFFVTVNNLPLTGLNGSLQFFFKIFGSLSVGLQLFSCMAHLFFDLGKFLLLLHLVIFLYSEFPMEFNHIFLIALHHDFKFLLKVLILTFKPCIF
ncbi:hypothetical protein H1C71_042352, partial [Ictidomys tridecemlineatus]